MDNLALLMSYVENERDYVGNLQFRPTKEKRWKNPKVWLSIIGFCLSLFTICLSGAIAEAAPVKVNARGGLNVRTGPGTGYRIVKTLDNGQATNTSGRLSNGWAQLDNGHWVARKYLTYTNSGGTGGGSPSTATVKSLSGVNVRTGPSTRYRIVNGLRNGTNVKISGRRSGQWVQLANGYWIHGDYLSFNSVSGGGTGGGSPSTATVKSLSGVNVRTGPSTRYRIVNGLRNGTNVKISGRRSGQWVQLANGYWIHGDYLSFNRGSGGGTGGGAPLTRYVGSYTSGANIRSGPGTAYRKLNYFSNGTKLTLTGRVSNGWYELTGNRGWIAGNLLRTYEDI